MNNLNIKPVARKKRDAVDLLGYAEGERGTAVYSGAADAFSRFAEEHQLKNRDSWKRFAQVFRHDSDDFDNGWRCEFWGKMMRGGCLTYMYSGSSELYEVLEDAVKDLLTAQRADGRFSTYSEKNQFSGWDLWGRKYVMTGFMHFIRICKDSELKERIITALMAHADHIVKHVGDKPGQKPIGMASDHWLGMNSCTILEPFMELYRLTGKARYLRFAEYIISTGGVCGNNIISAALGSDFGSFKREQLKGYLQFLNTNIERNGTARDNLIELAIEGKFKPYEYPVVKAYEMMSFFEGVLAYYEMTGEEKYLTAVVRFMDAVKETDITVIGCSGCTHELFDNSAAKQAEYSEIIMQETCVTVTWMRIIQRLYALTGDPKYIDCLERSAYNALYGSVNTEKLPLRARRSDGVYIDFDPLPFDSYSPLRANRRNKGIGGRKEFAFGGYYGCCACIASAGTAVLPRIATVVKKNGFAVNSFMSGEICAKTPKGADVKLISNTEYPVGDSYKLTVKLDAPERFTVDIRLPEWAEGASVKVNGRSVTASVGGYTSVRREWTDGDTVLVKLPMEIRTEWCEDRAAFVRGCVVLARDEAKTAGAVDAPLSLKDGFKVIESQGNEALRVAVGEVVLVDYASSGKRWTDERCRVNVWFDIEE